MPPPQNLNNSQVEIDTSNDVDLDFIKFGDPFGLWYIQMTQGTEEAVKMIWTPKQRTSWPLASRPILFMPTTVTEQIDGINSDIEAFLDFPYVVAQSGVEGNDSTLRECQHHQVVEEQVLEEKVVEEQLVEEQEVEPPKIPRELKQTHEDERKSRLSRTFIFGFASFAALVLKPLVAGGSGVPNRPTGPNPVCHSVRFTYLRECAPDVLCAAPVGAPPGTRFFAYDLPEGVVLFADTGNVTVPASKHGRASFSVFAESPDESGAPGYVQSVEVRHEELLAQPESMAQMVSKAAAGALGVSLGAVLYWLVTQND